MNGSEIVVNTLENHGVNRVFGNPGTTEIPLINSIQSSDLKYTLALHEDVAVGAATGYAMKMKEYYKDSNYSVSSPLSIVNLHSTPGLLHGLGNLYNCGYNNVPLLITTGSQDMDYEEKGPILSGNRESKVEDMVKYSNSVRNVENIQYVLRRAIKTALTPPMGPVFVNIPITIQEDRFSLFEEFSLGEIPEVSYSADKVEELSYKIMDADNITIIVGDNIDGSKAVDKITSVADKIGCPVYGEVYLSKSTFDTSRDEWVGVPSVREDLFNLINEGLVIEVGCSSNNTLLLKEKKRDLTSFDIVEISNSTEKLNRSKRSDYSIFGNIGKIFERLDNELDKHKYPDDKYKRNIVKATNMAKKRKQEIKSKYDNGEINRYNISKSIDEVVSKEDIVFDEGVTTGFVYRNLMNRSYGNFYGLKGGGLGQGIAASAGIGLAEQDVGKETSIYCLIGDGSFQYYPQALFTVARYLENQFNLIVVRNKGYDILKSKEQNNKAYTFENIGIKEICEGYGFEVKENTDKKIKESIRSLNKNKNSSLIISTHK